MLHRVTDGHQSAQYFLKHFSVQGDLFPWKGSKQVEANFKIDGEKSKETQKQTSGWLPFFLLRPSSHPPAPRSLVTHLSFGSENLRDLSGAKNESCHFKDGTPRWSHTCPQESMSVAGTTARGAKGRGSACVFRALEPLLEVNRATLGEAAGPRGVECRGCDLGPRWLRNQRLCVEMPLCLAASPLRSRPRCRPRPSPGPPSTHWAPPLFPACLPPPSSFSSFPDDRLPCTVPSYLNCPL